MHTTLRLVLTFSFFFMASAFAGSSDDNARVLRVGVGPLYDTSCGYKCMLVAFEAPPSGSACTFSSGWHYAIDISTPEGRTIAAVIISSKATQNSLAVGGDGNCVYNNGIEQLLYAYML